jgi:hypothetical protein
LSPRLAWKSAPRARAAYRQAIHIVGVSKGRNQKSEYCYVVRLVQSYQKNSDLSQEGASV